MVRTSRFSFKSFLPPPTFLKRLHKTFIWAVVTVVCYLLNHLTNTHVRAHTHTSARTHTHECTHAHTRVHVRTHTHARTHTHSRARAHTHTHTHLRLHARTNAHTLPTSVKILFLFLFRPFTTKNSFFNMTTRKK